MSDVKELAVFDFDGTSIKGNSPVLLVSYLARKKMIDLRVCGRIFAWGLAYKLRLPQNESWVRGLVFSAFEGHPVEEVDAFLHDFYDDLIERRFRPAADRAIAEEHDRGREVLVVSASFQPVIDRALQFHDFDKGFATQMQIDEQGRYTCHVSGLPVEGAEKLRVVKRYADERYGEGNWRLAVAYGDHHSDRDLLLAADQAYAVTPDNPLERTARQEKWPILDWDA